MNAAALYGITALLMAVSWHRDREKTKKALKKAWKAFENILPEFLVVILMVGVLLAVIDPEMISKIVGADSGIYGVALAAVIGAVTLIPGFIAFPMAAMLLKGGAGIFARLECGHSTSPDTH